MSSPRQHTPGPWDVEPKGSRHFVDGADGLTVAYLDRAGVRERQEIEPNACLIAAAPTMFDYLTLLASRGNDEAHEIIKKITGP